VEIQVNDVIKHPLDRVFSTYRDALSELAVYLPNIERIEVLEREELAGGDLRLLNLWKAAGAEIPTALRAFVKPEMLQWRDFAVWHTSEHACSWRTEIGFMKEAIHVEGRNTFEQDAQGHTRILIRGQIRVDASKIPGVPRLLAGSVGPGVERFVVNMITPNLKEVNRGLERYLGA
jgi:nitrogen fixation protein